MRRKITSKRGKQNEGEEKSSTGGVGSHVPHHIVFHDSPSSESTGSGAMESCEQGELSQPQLVAGPQRPKRDYETPLSPSSDSSAPLEAAGSIEMAEYPVNSNERLDRTPPLSASSSNQDYDEEEEEDDDASSVDPLMMVMDRIEDEIDGHAYDDLVPFHVKMALEDKIFGWNHLVADILGHILYTGTAFFLTYQLCTLLFLRSQYVDINDDVVDGSEGSSERNGVIACFFRNVFHSVKNGQGWTACNNSMPIIQHDSSSDLNIHHGYSRKPTLGMTMKTFVILRFLFSTMSAISAFRTVRRRKKVWFRAPYGSREYRQLTEQRTHNVSEADRTTRLGWIRASYGRRRDRIMAKRIRNKLRRATDRFERRYRRVQSSLRWQAPGSESITASATHRPKVKILSESVHSKPRRTWRRKTDRSGRGRKRGVVYHRANIEESKRLVMEEEQEEEEFGQQHISHTMPAQAMQSVGHDQISFQSGPIQNVPYAHGGFFGAAPFMLANPFWIDILRYLMPDVYVEISRRALYAEAPKLIHWAENNPVVAAYGTAHELEYSGKITTLEWDVFLDPHLVRRVEIVMDERDKLLRNASTRSGGDSKKSDDQTILRYYDAEIRRRAAVLVDRMLIAHGNLTQLVLEQTGFAKQYNFSRVKRTRRTLGGGIFAKQWLAVYAQALKLGMGHDDEDGVNQMVHSRTSSVRENYTPRPLSPPQHTHAQSEDLPLLSSNTTPQGQSSGCDSVERQKSCNPPSSPAVSHKSYGSSDDDGNCSSDSSTSSRKGNKRIAGCFQDGDYIYCDGSCLTIDLTSSDDLSVSHTSKNTEGKECRLVERLNMPEKEHTERQGKSETIEQSTSFNALASSSCPNTSIKESIDVLKSILDCNAPVGLVLDLKSRHIPKRIWAIIVDSLRDAGARVEGIASFAPEDIRGIQSFCASPVKELIFCHSAGDLQKACHEGKVEHGDSVFFNAGSLLWDRQDYSDYNVVKETLVKNCSIYFDTRAVKRGYRLMPYAQVKDKEKPDLTDSDNDTPSQENDEFQPLSTNNGDTSFDKTVSSTIQQYKEHYGLSIGLYCQEFCIDEAAINFLVRHVNENSDLYDLGLSWGGVNGVTIRGIQPGRFTSTDGLWNQRYAGFSWEPTLFPPSPETSQ